MTIRDLGYRPYDGVRLPPSHNTLVLLRHGIGRAWASWLVKIAVFLSWIPVLIVGLYYWYKVSEAAFMAQNAPAGAPIPVVEPATFARDLLNWQLWLFLTMITVGAGAGAIARDLTFRAFQFYFAKPVTIAQYLFGRIGAVGVWSFLLLLVPSLILNCAFLLLAQEGQHLERAGLLLPATLFSVLIALVFSTTSVAISSLSKSRALTISTWLLVLFVPHVIGTIVDAIAHWPWILLLSIPAQLGSIGDALFRITHEGESHLEWYYCAPFLAAITLGSVWLSYQRIRSAEVIT